MKAPRSSSSLLARILAAVVASVLVTAAGSFVFSNIAARSAFGNYVTRFASVRRQNFVAVLEEYHRITGGWAGVDEILEAVSMLGVGRGPGMGHMGQGMRVAEFDRVTLLDTAGRVIADTGDSQPGTQIAFESWEVTPVRSGTATVALVLMGAPEERQAATSLYADFVKSITAGTLYSVAGAAAIAMALSYYIAERMASPIRELTRAVSQVAEGNLTARVRAVGKDESGRLATAFNSMLAKLESVEKQRRDLVADVAHELRTPLTVLKSNFEGIKDGVIEGTPELMDALVGEVDRLSRLVADLHVLALADAGKLELNLDTVDLSRLLDHAQEAFGAVAGAKGIALEVNAEPGLSVTGDWTRLLQVVTNLLDNAIRHTPRGGRVGVCAGPVETRSARGDTQNRIALRVTDTGEGIASESLPHVFDRFYRGERSRSRQTGGSGLGLAIANDIVRAHGGEISVESEVGKGTTFTVTLDFA